MTTENKFEYKPKNASHASSSTNVHLIGEDLLRALYKLFYLQFCVSSDQRKNALYQRFYKEFERHFYMKIIVTIIPTILVPNLLLSLFYPFVEAKSKNQVFSKLVVW